MFNINKGWKAILCLACILVLIMDTKCSAQNLGELQWVAGGGGVLNSNGFSYDEGVYFIGTDDAGNVYGISEINSTSPQLDSFSLAQGLGASDILLFSYTCSGQLRWARHFGGSSQDYVTAMVVDAIGNCYISASIRIYSGNTTARKFGDTLLAGNLFVDKSAVYVKIDSNGHTKWINYPGPDPGGSASFGHNHTKLKLDDNGILHSLVSFYGSTNWGGLIPQQDLSVVKFNANNGQIIGLAHLNDFYGTSISSIHYQTYFEMDDANNYYLLNRKGGDTTYIGTDTLLYYPAPNDTAKTILAKWDSTGNLLWYKVHRGGTQNQATFKNLGLTFTGLLGGFKVIDNEIFITGFVYDSIGTETFLGLPIPIRTKTPYLEPSALVAKFNAVACNGVWINRCERRKYGQFYGSSFNKLPNNEIFLLGNAGGDNGSFFINNSKDSLQVTVPLNDASNILTLFDANTGYIKLDTGIVQKGNTVIPYISTVDKDGNIYFGGVYNNKLWNSAHTDSCTYYGGLYDFYIAKYGASCGCHTYKPWPKLMGTTVNSVQALVQDVVFGSDSLVWFWGDGTSTKTKCDTASTTHVYSSGGAYNVCLRNYSPCGQTDSCFVVNIVLDAPTIAVAQILVYPNPTQTHVNISYPYTQKGEVVFYDLAGKAVYRANLVNGLNTIELRNMPSGVYTYNVVAQSGQVYKGKLVIR
jgi:hypothetical protein